MISLRALLPSDAPAVRRVYSGAAVEFLGRPAMTGPEAEEYVARARESATVEPVERYVLGVDEAGEVVGIVKLTGRWGRPGGHGRVGYVLREDCWGRGYATSAVHQLVAFAFTVAGFTSLGARHHPANLASGRVLTKTGFTLIGPAPPAARAEYVRLHLAGKPSLSGA
ncbi:GNAT family N-acetyltransferase [Streptomyces sp. NPDC000594]|uniref:GNAT family N-acetyltransferase n=1 Tax=Streptomyces sp. NPDC000594 TaxID=3154261 RepID=UPI00332A2D5E